MATGILNMGSAPTAAMVARYRQLKGQGVPDDQAIAMIQQNGVTLPVENVVEKYKALQAAMAQSNQPPVPQGTINDQITAQLQQAQGQQVPMQQGIAALPAENIGNEQRYAKGGIVAFADGGDTSDEEPEYITSLEGDPEYAGTLGLGDDAFDYVRFMGARPNLARMRSEAANSPAARALQKALEEQEAYNKRREAEISTDKNAKLRRAIEMGALALMKDPSSKVTTAAARSLFPTAFESYWSQEDADKKEREALEQKRLDLEFKRAQALESNDARVLQAYNSDLNNYRTQVTSYIDRQKTNERLEANARAAAAARTETARIAAINAGGFQMQMFNRLINSINPDTGKKYTTQEALREINQNSASYMNTNLRNINAQILGLQRELADKEKQQAAAFGTLNKQAFQTGIDALKKEIARLKAQQLQGGGIAAGLGDTGEAGGSTDTGSGSGGAISLSDYLTAHGA